QAVDLGPRLVRDLPAVRVLVPPADRRGQAFVVGQDRARRPAPLAGFPLLRIEGPPLRTFVDDHVVQHESAVLADDLGARIVPDQVVSTALRTCRCNLDLTHSKQSSPARRTACIRNRDYINPFLDSQGRYFGAVRGRSVATSPRTEHSPVVIA